MIYLGQDLHAARWNGKALHGAAHGLHLVLEHSYFSMELEILLRQRTLHSSCTRHLHEFLHAVAAAYSTADMVLAREREREGEGQKEGGRKREGDHSQINASLQDTDSLFVTASERGTGIALIT